MQKYEKKQYQFQKATLHWVQNMLLCNEIMLKDVPYEVRTESHLVYIMAFRASRNVSCKRYIKDLQILCQDIHLMDDANPQKEQLLRTLSSGLTFHNFQEDLEFVDFQKSIYEDVLYKLQEKEQVA